MIKRKNWSNEEIRKQKDSSAKFYRLKRTPNAYIGLFLRLQQIK